MLDFDSIIPFWKHCIGDTFIILFYNVYISVARIFEDDHVKAGTYSMRLSSCCASWYTLHLSNHVYDLVLAIESSEGEEL